MVEAWLIRASVALLLASPAPVQACGAIAERIRPMLASTAPAAEDAVQITFLGHASFNIVTPGGISAVTDYSGMHVPERVPDVVTMNHAHSTHYTDHPDPRIRYVLRGWAVDGKPAQYDLKVGDLRIHNLPTNIRDWNGGTEYYGNSIFVFESAGLCIAHLGHLHHLLTDDDLATLGAIDVVMAPVDGALTMSQADMAAVVDSLHPHLVLPMHYFSEDRLRNFLERMRDRYEIVISPGPSTEVSRASLPERPRVLVLPGPMY